MANVLNFSRHTVHDFLEQLGDARIQLGKLQAKVSVAWERVNRVRDRCTKERISKQKSVMRYIREQLRISDIRKILSEVGERAAEHLDDLLHTERGGLLGMRDQAMKDTMALLVQASGDLAALATGNADGAGDTASLMSSANNGSLEIRLADSQIDDETLHGVVGLLCGVLAPAAQDLGGSDKHESYDGFNRMVAGEAENSASIDRKVGGSNILMASLGVKVSEKQISAANDLARSILSVRCDYTERVLFMNLRGNSLTDLSCKVLAAMVEKSSALRMLDLRENLLSTTGAKFLFDATRRNITVLYVTQRQNGYMIEGHREILGNGAPVSKNKAKNNYEGSGLDIGDSQHMECDNTYSQQRSMPQSGEVPKHPLRIDMRNNNPSKEAIEGLLESVDYKSAVRYLPPPEGAPPDQPLSLQTIVNDTRSFEDAYSGQPIQPPEPFQMRYAGQDEQSSFTPAGLTRNQFSGMLSTVQGEHVHPYANGEKKRRPQSAGDSFPKDRPLGLNSSIGNKLYNTVRNSSQLNRYDDDDDDDNDDLDIRLGSDIKAMIVARKDREKGIIGVGGLLEQQIRKLQLTQPMNGAIDSSRGENSQPSMNETSWDAYNEMRKPEKKKKNAFNASSPARQHQLATVYSASVPTNKSPPLQSSSSDKAQRNIGTTCDKSSNNVAGFTNVLHRAKSAGQVRPTSASSGARRTQNSKLPIKKGIQSKDTSRNAAAAQSSTSSSVSSSRLPNVGGKPGHHEALQNKINGYNLNPTLLF